MKKLPPRTYDIDDVDAILREVLKRPIAYYPVFADIGGSVNAGILLSQLWYWRDKGSNPDGWIYKSQADMTEETRMKRTELENARKLLRNRGLIEEIKRDIPPKMYYRINHQKLIDTILENSAYNAGNLQNKMRDSRTTQRGKPARKESETSPEITHTESPPLNVSDTPSTQNDNALANMRQKAVQEIVSLTGDSSSRRRFQQLFGIAEEHGRQDDWEACLRTLRRRLTITEAPLERPGAYFCKMLADRLLEHGVSVPVGSKAEREEVRRLVRESLGNE